MLTIASCFIVCLEHFIIFLLLDYGKLIDDVTHLQYRDKVSRYYCVRSHFIFSSPTLYSFSRTSLYTLVPATTSSSTTVCLQ